MTEYEKDEDGNLLVIESTVITYSPETLANSKAFKENQIAELIANHNENLALLTQELADIEALILTAQELGE